jgi:hypothetical protein
MPSFRQCLLTSAFALAAAAPSLAQTSDVKVVNPASNPVQTKIVNPASAPVPTKIINTAGAPVQTRIVNGVTTPVPVKVVDDAAREPFQKSLSFTTSANNTTYTVPAGKRLVIEFASAHFRMPVDVKVTNVTLTTQISSSSGPVPHYLVAHFQGNRLPPGLGFQTTDEYTASQQLRVIAGPGTQVKFGFEFSTFVSQVGASMTISGYLLPVPGADAAEAAGAGADSESQDE